MNLEDRLQKINRLSVDLDAAFLVSVLFEEQPDRDKVFINLLGLLKRRWSTDIDSAQVDTFENGEKFYSLNLNRPGIYDSLPEAVFHNFPNMGSNSGKEMAKESRRQKLVEKEARLFFKPLENEIFNHRVQLSLVENRLFHELTSQFLNKESHDFWLTANEVPGKYVTKFNRFLPFAHLIVGNLELTSHCLGYILEEDIKIELSHNLIFSDVEDEPPLNSVQLGDCMLGSDSILAFAAENHTGFLNIKVGPLQHTPLTEFLNNGEAKQLLDCFSEYYIPFELETMWNIVMEREDSYFVLSDETKKTSSYLSYSTVI